MNHWASASWAWLLLHCSFPWDKHIDRDEAGEPARYGSAFHEGIARLLRGERIPAPWLKRNVARWGLKSDAAEELRIHIRESHAYFSQWLRGRNEFGIVWPERTAQIEKAVALTPLVGARSIALPDEEHRYHGLKPYEIPGTFDYVNTHQTLIVVDHKTGESEDFSQPETKPQLLILGAAMMRLSRRKECIVAVHHTRRRGLPKMYAEKITLADVAPFEKQLQNALARIGDGSLRPGTWCERCPGAAVCPARDGALLDRAGDVLTGLTAAGGALSTQGLSPNDVAIATVSKTAITPEHKLGVLYEIARLAERMNRRIRDELRAHLLANPGILPETPSGEYLVIREYDRETISKSSILEAFGKVGGERELKRLREAGAVNKTKVVAVYPEKERGK